MTFTVSPADRSDLPVGPTRTQFVLIGGFLGAGKTTLIGQLARRYADAGKSVGIITNDQATNLVDTHNLRARGFQVGEVDGACFCCSFDHLVETAGKLGDGRAPDVLLAEPVGSCTDLVATVILPLERLYGERFDLAPFGVLLKPSHGKRILAGPTAKGRQAGSGFSPQAEYIFRKQLEEADYVMIGRGDQLSAPEVAELQQQITQVAGEIPVVVVSPKTGHGIERVIECIDSTQNSRRERLEIDYDTYADGEAQLGWVNLSARLKPVRPLVLDSFSASLVAAIAQAIELVGASGAGEFSPTKRYEIAHLKASIFTGQSHSIANQVASFSGVEWGVKANSQTMDPANAVINARVAIDPELLQGICREKLVDVAQQHGCEVSQIQAHSLRPGRPEPTHRYRS